MITNNKQSNNNMSCNICCEDFNKKTRQPVKCGFCDFTSCIGCGETYILGSFEDPQCMNCHKEWNREFLCNNFSKNFLDKRFKDHRKNVLFDREKALFPFTQGDVDIAKIQKKNAELRRQLIAEKHKLWNQYQKARRALDDFDMGINVIKHEGIETCVRTKKCPLDDCKGFLDSKWTCGICEKTVCNRCYEEKCDDHECDEGTVETMKLLKKDSKPCPSCGTLITKIDGCDQMWCTKSDCHTAFSWKTGNKVSGNIHNPHYLQFRAQHGGMDRDPNDIECGGLPNLRNLDYLIRTKNLDKIINIPMLYQLIQHVSNVTIPRYNRNNRNVRVTNTDLRVKFMLDEVDEDRMKIELHKREKVLNRDREISDIFVMFRNTMSDIMRNIYERVKTSPKIDDQVDLIDKLVNYSNNELKRVGDVYKLKTPEIIKPTDTGRRWVITT